MGRRATDRLCGVEMGKKPYLWICVEADEYELPLAVADTAQELADMLGVKEATVTICVAKQCDGRHSGRKYMKVRREE